MPGMLAVENSSSTGSGVYVGFIFLALGLLMTAVARRRRRTWRRETATVVDYAHRKDHWVRVFQLVGSDGTPVRAASSGGSCSTWRRPPYPMVVLVDPDDDQHVMEAQGSSLSFLGVAFVVGGCLVVLAYALFPSLP